MNKVITISREYGAGGHTIGQQVAKELGIPFYDKDIVRETAKASGFDLELVEQEGEDISKMDAIFKSICAATSSNYKDTQEAIHDVQKAIILRFAKEGPCVILGRCADEILREAGIPCVNVFIHADMEHRLRHAAVDSGITDPVELQKFVTRKDKSRHTYYDFYTNNKWADSRNYTLSLDSGALGYDRCVKYIIETACAEE